MNRRRFLSLLTAVASNGIAVTRRAFGAPAQRKVYIVSNFHPASCGWLTTFSKERVYCANSYLTHLKRAGGDPASHFVLSEANNVSAIMRFQPDKIAELKQRRKQKRVELVNGFFLESTINLSGGEALVRM